MKYRESAGFFSIEALAALCIGVPCLLSTAAFLAYSCRNYTKVSKETHFVFNAVKVKDILNEISSDCDRHSYPVYPRIHKQGVITFANGIPNLISNASDKLPAKDSDAITYARSDTIAMLEVLERRGVASAAVFKACARYGDYFDKEKYNSFWIVLPNEIIEAYGSAVSIGRRLDQPCFQLHLRSDNSMLFSNSSYNTQLARYIIPIESTYTYFLDISGRLRFIGHRGKHNIENQPVLEEIRQIKLEKDSLYNSWGVNAELLSHVDDFIRISSSSHLTKTAGLNLFLNSN